jgi:ABC-type transport system involved in cytochrome c biogenesis permease component
MRWAPVCLVTWIVILVGAIISLSASFFFKVEDGRLHAIQVTLLAILAFDRPFRGDQLIYDHLMKP